jgi:hypothetical protein
MQELQDADRRHIIAATLSKILPLKYPHYAHPQALVAKQGDLVKGDLNPAFQPGLHYVKLKTGPTLGSLAVSDPALESPEKDSGQADRRRQCQKPRHCQIADGRPLQAGFVRPHCACNS